MIRQLIDVSVPMRDGVRLSADIRHPETGGPFPTILLRTPYGSADPTGYRSMVNAGYAVVEQDCRGRFDSDGRFRPFCEAEDGFDTIAWIRAQPWCDGRIGSFGGSYLGFTQLAAASLRPPGLRAIVPQVMGGDLFQELVCTNGVLNLELAASWSFHTAGHCRQENSTTDWQRVLRHLPLNTLAECAGYRLPHLDEWLAHPVYDDFWRARSFAGRLEDFTVPALHIGGWYDAFINGQLRNFSGINTSGGPGARGRQKLIVGPWAHAVNTRNCGQLDFGPQAVIDLAALTDRWLARWVLDRPNGIDEEPPVRVFVMGENTWRNYAEWPPADCRQQLFHLQSNGRANSLHGDGALSPDKPAPKAAQDIFVYNPDNPAPTMGGAVLGELGGPRDHAPVERRDDVLVYTSAELQAPLTVIGPVTALIFAASDAPDTDFIARLCDVYPDGRSMVVCDGIVRARFRHGLERETMLTPGEVCEYRIELGATANSFLPGHRLRLEITSSCFPRFARNLNTGEPAATSTRMQCARQTVFHGGARPSRLILTVAGG